MKTKICSKKECEFKGEPQPFSNFHKNKSKKDGLQFHCKSCRALFTKSNQAKLKEKQRKHYIKNKKTIRAKQKIYNEENKEKIQAQHQIYRKTPKGKGVGRKSEKKYKKNNQEKYKAHNLLWSAVLTRKIIKPKFCSICRRGDCIIDGHHEDYSKPLEVIWCCRICHKKIHKELLIT